MAKYTLPFAALIILLFASPCFGVVSENSRRSVVYIAPVPSGEITKNDRRQAANVYILPSSTLVNPVTRRWWWHHTIDDFWWIDNGGMK